MGDEEVRRLLERGRGDAVPDDEQYLRWRVPLLLAAFEADRYFSLENRGRRSRRLRKERNYR